jgi:nicotinate dehydrogenase subunit B
MPLLAQPDGVTLSAYGEHHKAAADAFKWDKRPSPKRLDRGEILAGRGIAYAYRSQTVAAEIAEVEVNRRTGHVWVKRMVCAYDCGLVVNPEALRRAVENGMLHSLSRTLHEEVRFDTEKVTSANWASYPTMTHLDTPESLEVVLVNGDPEPEAGGPAALRRGRDRLQAYARGDRQRALRRHRRPPAARAAARRAGARGAEGGEGVAPSVSEPWSVDGAQ